MGYRGTLITATDERLTRDFGLEKSFALGTTSGPLEVRSRELAARLVEAAQEGAPSSLAESAASRVSKSFLVEQILGADAARFLSERERGRAFRPPAKLLDCPTVKLPYRPAFWNDPAHIRHNNCYAFASNQRTDSFPQPGRASGAMYGSLDCAEVGRAAIADGGRWDGDCFDRADDPLYVALVIWPGQDYHWYRLQEGDFWAHKPGGTPATDRDSSGLAISNPQACDRGPYSHFCGYMLLPKSQRVA